MVLIVGASGRTPIIGRVQLAPTCKARCNAADRLFTRPSKFEVPFWNIKLGRKTKPPSGTP